MENAKETALEHTASSDSEPLTEAHFYDVPDMPSDPKVRKRLCRKILKNIYIIAFVFLLHFTAYTGLGNLQSSLHREEGMGTISLSAMYVALVISCFFLPKIMMTALGHKWTMSVALCGYLLWMAANGYAIWATMIPTSILLGFSAAPLWTTQSSYYVKIAPRYAQLNVQTTPAVVSRFFGIFFGIVQMSGLVSSVISSTVLRPDDIPGENETLTAEEVEQYCGANDCPWNNITNPNLADPPSTVLWTLVGIYIGIACIGVVIMMTCVDNLPRYLQDDKSKVKQETKRVLLNTIMHSKYKRLWLIIPSTMYIGLTQAFYLAEWTKSYVSCSLGIWMVGLVLIPSYIVNALMSFASSHVTKYTGRMPVCTVGFVGHIAILLVLLLWPLDKTQEYAFYLLAMSWGFIQGILKTQINVVYGVFWPKESEAAFCNYWVWESIGYLISFVNSSLLCTAVKIYILLAFLALGMTGYYIAEVIQRRSIKNQPELDEDIKPENATDVDMTIDHDEQCGHFGDNDILSHGSTVPGGNMLDYSNNGYQMVDWDQQTRF